MTNETILLFLHGVGKADREDKWTSHLSKSLTGWGYPELTSVHVIAPKYAHALSDWDEKVPLPVVTIKQPSREASRQNRRDFERRTGAVEFRLGRHDRGSGYFGGDTVVGLSVGLPLFKQAHNYLNNRLS